MQWNYDQRDVFLEADAQETRDNGHHELPIIELVNSYGNIKSQIDNFILESLEKFAEKY